MADSAKALRMWNFGDWSVDRHNKEIVGRDGRKEGLDPKEFPVLDFLIQNSNDFYTAEDLVKKLWKECVVPNNVEQIVSHIRAKLRNLGLDPDTIIEGKKGKGYRFLLTPVISQDRLTGKEVTDVIHNLPFFRRANWIERADLLDFIDEKFLGGQPNSLIALYGLGGIGKTQAAVQYAYRAIDRKAYRLVWWLGAANTFELTQGFDRLKDALKIAGDAEQLQKIHSLGPSLFIFDDAKEASDLLPHIIHDSTVRILITSRNPNWSEIGISKEVLRPDRTAVIAYLCSATSSQDSKNAERLAVLVGDLPLAAAQAVGYIQAARLTIADYNKLFETCQSEMLQRGGPLAEYESNVATTWELAFNSIQENRAAVTLLEMASFFGSTAISKYLFAERPSKLPEELVGSHFDLTYSDAVAILGRHSLIGVGPDEIYIHPLVAAVTRDRLAPEKRERILESILSYFAVAFGAFSPDTVGRIFAGYFIPHVLTACSWASKYNINIKAAGQLLIHVAYMLYHDGKEAAAETPARTALHLYSQWADASPLDLAFANSVLGHVLSKLGKFGDARKQFLATIECEERATPPDRGIIIQWWYCLAETYYRDHDLSEALKVVRKTVEMERELHGEESEDFAAALEILGFVLEKTGNSIGAAEYNRRAKEIYLQLGEKRPKKDKAVIEREWIATGNDFVRYLQCEETKEFSSIREGLASLVAKRKYTMTAEEFDRWVIQLSALPEDNLPSRILAWKKFPPMSEDSRPRVVGGPP